MSNAPGLEGWEPTEERLDDVVTPAAAAALHGLLDSPGPPPKGGEALPPLWHWLAFLPRVAQAGLGPDGHPRKGGFLPPVALPRRMFVGGEVRIPSAVLTVDAPLVRTGRVASIEAKSGRSGDLVFVSVDYQVAGSEGAGVHETQRLVYRPAAPPGPGTQRTAPTSQERGPDDRSWTIGLDLAIDPTLLFRFSALTYNAHRIHYDRAWAIGEEGYPGLVVHGPLQAIGLAELCRRDAPDRPVGSFGFRSLQPAFDDGPLRLRGRVAADGTWDLAAFDHLGNQTMTAAATSPLI